jgi:hypothetical protein
LWLLIPALEFALEVSVTAFEVGQEVAVTTG